jgi:spore germination protein KB
MNKELISGKQAVTIMVLFLIGSTIVTGVSSEAKQDSWIAFLLSIAMAVPALFVYARILHLFPGYDLYDIVFELYGKIVGRIITVLFIWYAIHLGSMVIRNYSEFVQIVAMPETPQLIIVLCMGILCIYAVKSGIETLGKWSMIICPFVIIVVLFTTILSLKDMKIHNLMPVMESLNNITDSSFDTFAFPLAETVLLTTIFSSIRTKDSVYKVYYWGLGIGGLVILILTLRNLLVLGAPMIADLYFPTYYSASIIQIGNYISRIEGSVASLYILSGFVKISVCLFAASKGVSKVFNLESYRPIVAPIGILMMTLSCTIYTSVMEMFEFMKIYSYYMIPFQIILPLVILITAEINVRLKTKKELQPAKE